MEFDIMNEIMTQTVAQLFTNKQIHQNFFKTSTEIGDQPNIPMDKSFSLAAMPALPTPTPVPVIDDLPTPQQKFGATAPPIQSVNPEERKAPPVDIVTWLQNDGRKRLEDSMAKMKLDS